MKVDRYHASLLKTNDLPTTPLYVPKPRLVSSTPTAQHQSPSPPDSITDSMVSLAKVTTIPRCRDSIISNTNSGVQLVRNLLSSENSQNPLPSTFMYANTDETKMASFFEINSNGHTSPIPYSDCDSRKNASRLPLEAVPELSELDIANSRYTFDPTTTSTLPHIHRSSQQVQPSPMLITFDSSSLKSRN